MSMGYEDIEPNADLPRTNVFIPNVSDSSMCYCCGRSQKDLDELAENLSKKYAARIEEASARLRERHRTSKAMIRGDYLKAAKNNDTIDPLGCKRSFTIRERKLDVEGTVVMVGVCTVCDRLALALIHDYGN